MSTPPAHLTDNSCSVPNQRFPSYLKQKFTLLQSLSLNAISFTPGEFAPLLNSRHFLPGLQNLTSLTLKNMPDFPRIILASCVRLKQLDIASVHISDDASRTIPVQRAQLAILMCKDIDDYTFAQLVSVVDVTRLTSLACELARGSTIEGQNVHPRGPQRVLDLCRRSLRYLALRSKLALQPPNRHEAMVICDLSHHSVLTKLLFGAMFNPECDHLHPHLPQKLVLDELLATIPCETSTLKTLNYKVDVCIDQALKCATPGGALRLDNTEPLPFFRHPAWHGFDRTLAKVANVRPMRVIVDITGMVAPETQAVYDQQDMFYDSIDMASLMEQWGRNVFLEVTKAPRVVIEVSASIFKRDGCLVKLYA